MSSLHIKNNLLDFSKLWILKGNFIRYKTIISIFVTFLISIFALKVVFLYIKRLLHLGFNINNMAVDGKLYETTAIYNFLHIS